jgi:hypothetical protein
MAPTTPRAYGADGSPREIGARRDVGQNHGTRRAATVLARADGGIAVPVGGARAVPLAEPKWPPRPKVEDARGATEVELNDQTTPRAPQCSARRSLRLRTRSYDAAARKRQAGGRARINPIGPRRFLLPTEAAGAVDRARL